MNAQWFTVLGTSIIKAAIPSQECDCNKVLTELSFKVPTLPSLHHSVLVEMFIYNLGNYV